ncbi:MAG TPA: nucleotidyltransferase domain-containing protein [Firmicutes bacterium]|nr:nucleotidyltransferase domain-containing protein [Bacillota bacterium]
MKEFLSMKDGEKEKLVRRIKDVLSSYKEISFAYIFGSFTDSSTFRDIDIGIYLYNIKREEVFDFEFRVSEKISEAIGIDIEYIDVRVLNFAPYPFLNSIFKDGKLLFARDMDFLTDLIEETSLDAIANEYISEESLRELMER